MTQSTATIAAITGLVIGSVATVAAANMFTGTRTSSKGEESGGSTSSAAGQNSRAAFCLPAALAASVVNSDDQVNFLSDMLNRLWPYINVSGSDMIRDTVEPMFKDMLPGPMATLRFTKVDLGKVPMRIDNVVVHDLKDGTVQFDMDITWDSDSDIQLKADYVGSFGVKSIKLNGRMTFLLNPLTNVLPIVSAIQYAFTNPPELELDFTGLANIADCSFIDKSIRAVMQEVMASMVVLPNRMLYKMDLLSDYREFYQHPVGVARITCVRGRGFLVEEKVFGKHDVPDVYCNIKVGCEKLWRTCTVKDNLAPTWNEANDFLLCDNDQVVSIEAWDEDNGALDKDDFLGSTNVTVGDILLAGKTLEVELQISNKGTGSFVTLHCDVLQLTLSELSSLQGPAKPNQLAGLLTVIVTKALNLPLEKEDAASFVKVTCCGQEFVTGVVVNGPGYDAINPIFDIAFRVPLTGEATESTVKLELMNADKILGEIIVEHADLVTATNQTISERRAVGSDGAAIDFLVTLAGVANSDEVSTPLSKASIPSDAETKKDKVRVSVISAHGFRVQKKRGFLKKDDVPDVYCQIKFGSSPKVYRTPTIKNEVKPVWKNASSEYHLSSSNQVIVVDVYDENRKGEDDYLGNIRIAVGKVLLGGGLMELELQDHGVGTGAFILLRCDKI